MKHKQQTRASALALHDGAIIEDGKSNKQTAAGQLYVSFNH